VVEYDLGILHHLKNHKISIRVPRDIPEWRDYLLTLTTTMVHTSGWEEDDLFQSFFPMSPLSSNPTTDSVEFGGIGEDLDIANVGADDCASPMTKIFSLPV
jgi:hypothetical protein